MIEIRELEIDMARNGGVFKNIFIDGISGITQGLFATLILGTLLAKLGTLLNGDLGNIIYSLGIMAICLTSVGVSVGIATKYKETPLMTISAVLVGVIGGYATQLLSGSVISNGNLVLNGMGDPLGAIVTTLIGLGCGHLVSGKTKIDLVLTPATCIIAGTITGLLMGPYLDKITSFIEKWITYGITEYPFVMGVIVAVIVLKFILTKWR